MDMTVTPSIRSSTLFLSFFREDPKTVYRELKRKNPRDAFWGVTELTLFVFTFVILGVLNWRYICFLVPFWYFGHCLSYLNGYYRHYGGNPDEPLAWGVSSYDKLYNWIWFFNGFHAEHHFRPKVHWTRMQALRDQIVERQRAAGVRVIKPPHALAFLDPDLPGIERALPAKISCPLESKGCAPPRRSQLRFPRLTATTALWRQR